MLLEKGKEVRQNPQKGLVQAEQHEEGRGHGICYPFDKSQGTPPHNPPKRPPPPLTHPRLPGQLLSLVVLCTPPTHAGVLLPHLPLSQQFARSTASLKPSLPRQNPT